MEIEITDEYKLLNKLKCRNFKFDQNESIQSIALKVIYHCKQYYYCNISLLYKKELGYLLNVIHKNDIKIVYSRTLKQECPDVETAIFLLDYLMKYDILRIEYTDLTTEEYYYNNIIKHLKEFETVYSLIDKIKNKTMKKITSGTVLNLKENNLTILEDLSVNTIINGMYVKIGTINTDYKYWTWSNITINDIKEIEYFSVVNNDKSFNFIAKKVMNKLEEFNTLSDLDKIKILGE